MNFLIVLVSLALLIALPIGVIMLVYRLVDTRNDGRVAKGKSAPPWSDGLYSAAKRATLAWAVEIAFCIVAYAGIGFNDIRSLPGQCHFWLMVAIPIAAFVWGLVKPRIYTDGVKRDRDVRYDAWIVLAFLLFFVFAPVFWVTRTIAPFRNVDRESGRIEMRADAWDAWRFRNSPIAPNMIPWDAKEIAFSYLPPALLGLGGSAELRCKVEKDDLLAFAKARGYEFQAESLTRNFCANGCGDCDFVHQVWRKYNGDIPYPKDFLAYSYRYATCGGYSFFYDVAAKTLYAEWSSN